MALEELGIADRYNIVRVSVSNDGQWCARLVAKNQNEQDVSVCIEAEKADPAANVDRFKDKLTRYLGL